MKNKLIILILFSTSVIFSQQMIKLDGSKSAIIMEVGAVISLENKKLIVTNIIGKEGNKTADIRKGDEILYINSKKITDPKELRKIYEEVKTGAEIKLGINRKGNKFFAAFKKEDAPQGQKKIIKMGGDGKMKDEKGNEIKEKRES